MLPHGPKGCNKNERVIEAEDLGARHIVGT